MTQPRQRRAPKRKRSAAAARKRAAAPSLMLIGLCGAAALGWGAYWTSVAGEIRTGLAALAAAPSGAWRVSADRPRIAGFPLSMRLRFEDLRVDSPYRWAWRADRVDVALQPWRMGRARFHIAGRHVLIPAEGPAGAIDVAARRGDGDLDFTSDGVIQRFRIRLTDAAAILPSGQAASAATLRLDLERKPDGDGALNVEAEAIAVTDALAAPLGPSIAAFALRGVASSPALLTDAAAWRAADGRATIERIRIETPAFALDGRGAGAIDAQGFLAGRLETRIRPPAGFIDTLARQGVASPDAAAAAKILFALLGDGAAAPLTAFDGGLYIGPARIADAPRLIGDDAR